MMTCRANNHILGNFVFERLKVVCCWLKKSLHTFLREFVLFQSQPIANQCLVELLKYNHNDPVKLLSLLYRAYPPRCDNSLITDEDTLRTLSMKELRNQIHLAMLCYEKSSRDVIPGSGWKHVCEEVGDVLMLLRTQLIGRDVI